MTRRQLVAAFAAVLVAALLWGLAGTAAEVLFQVHGFDPSWLVGVRMTISALILLAVLRPRLPRQDIGPLALFGVIGLGIVQFTYYVAIADANVATATFLQYLAPAMYAAFVVVTTRRLPTPVTLAAILLAVTGTFMLVFSGSAADLTPAALVYGLASAAAMAFYSSYPRPLIRRLGPWPTTTWGLLFGGVSFAVVHPFWEAPFAAATSVVWALLAFVVVFGTLVPFGLYIFALQVLPPAEGMVLATFEPISAALAAIVFLGRVLSPVAYLGGVLVVTAVLLLALYFRAPGGEAAPTPREGVGLEPPIPLSRGGGRA